MTNPPQDESPEPDELQAEASRDATEELHPDLVEEISRRQASGEKPIPAEQVYRNLGL